MSQVATANSLASSETLIHNAVPSVFGFVATVAYSRVKSTAYIPQYGARDLTVSYLSAAKSESAPAAVHAITCHDYDVEELARSQRELDGLFDNAALQWIPDPDEPQQLSSVISAVALPSHAVVPDTASDVVVNASRSTHRSRISIAIRLLGLAAVASAAGYAVVRPDLPTTATHVRPATTAKIPQQGHSVALPTPHPVVSAPAVATVQVQKPIAATVIPPSVRAITVSSLPLPRVEPPPVVFEHVKQRETEPRGAMKENSAKDAPANGKIVLLDPDVPVQRKDDIPSPGKFVLYTDVPKNSAGKSKPVQEQQ